MGSAMSTVREVYVSTDVEADGPIPGPNSMLSLGSVALRADGSLVDEFTVNLQPLDRTRQPEPQELAVTHEIAFSQRNIADHALAR